MEVVRVVLHEAHAPVQAVRHDLHRAHQRRVLPVPFRAIAVAVGHQPLDGQARQLPQPAEILESVGETGETTRFQKCPQAHFDASGLHQRRALVTAGTQRRLPSCTARHSPHTAA